MEDWLNPAALGPLCALSSSITWAIGSAGYSRLTQQYSAFAVNFARALVALPLFILVSFLISGGFWEGIASYQTVRASHWAWFALSMTASLGLGDTLFLWSTRSLGVPGALAIGSCFPLWTVLAGYLFSHQSISTTQGLGMLVTLCGVIIVVLNGPKSGSISIESKKVFPLTGFLLAIATSIAWATNSFTTARGGVDISTPVGATIRMIMALILSAGFGRLIAPQSSILLPKRQMVHSLWLFVLEAFAGSFFYVYGMSHSPLVLGSTLASLSPVLSVPAAFILGLEKFSILRTLGVILAVVGVWLLLGAF